jgi:hypothetical protein
MAARLGDTVIMAILPPAGFLLLTLGLLWAAAGFNQESN